MYIPTNHVSFSYTKFQQANVVKITKLNSHGNVHLSAELQLSEKNFFSVTIFFQSFSSTAPCTLYCACVYFMWVTGLIDLKLQCMKTVFRL